MQPFNSNNNLISEPQKYQTNIGTYNILMKQPQIPKPYSTKMGYDYIDGSPIENSLRRYPIIKNNIINSNVDILCLQELVKSTFENLKMELAEFDYICDWEKHENHHGVGIFYKGSRYFKISRKISLFETQKTFEQSTIKTKRIHLTLDLLDKITNVVFRIVSVHLFDPRSLEQPEDHSDFVIRETHDYPKYKIHRTIIAGDMNLDQWGNEEPRPNKTPNLKKIKGFQPFTSNNYKTDGSFENSEYEKDETNHISAKNRRIDYIFVRSGTKPKPLETKHFDLKGSDHHLVISSIHDKQQPLPLNLNDLLVQAQSLPML